MYVLQQPTSVVTTPTNVTLSNLINPTATQMADYNNINNIKMTFYDGYHPNNEITFDQPPFTYFVPFPSTMPATYSTDIRVSIPNNTPCIVKLGISIQQTLALLTKNKDNLLEIKFDAAGVNKLL